MIICSWNVRGLGGRVKKRKVKELIIREKVEVMAIQETKLGVIDKKMCSQLWGGDDVDWRSAPANYHVG
jgi:exonuclease III